MLTKKDIIVIVLKTIAIIEFAILSIMLINKIADNQDRIKELDKKINDVKTDLRMFELDSKDWFY